MLRPSNRARDQITIDYIRFVSKWAKYARQPHAVDYETLGADMRRALSMWPDQTLVFAPVLPKTNPTLQFGTGVLTGGRETRCGDGTQQRGSRLGDRFGSAHRYVERTCTRCHGRRFHGRGRNGLVGQ